MKKIQIDHEKSLYVSPGTEIIEVPLQKMICQSNVSMSEDYLGDGGFTEEDN